MPATIANLGPGFDCLGVAIGVYLRIRVTSSDKPQITGKGRIRSLGDNLTFQAFRAAFETAGAVAPTVTLEMLEIYPSARGMGASASAIVAGLLSARVGGGLDLDDNSLAQLAMKMEGHGDNVLPALFGGLVVNSHDQWQQLQPVDAVQPVVLTAKSRFKTSTARSVLPDNVSREDAVANAAATATLVAILTGSISPDALMDATTDRLHEPYRLPLMPESRSIHTELRSRGVATTMAGAGPSLVCLVSADKVMEVAEIARSIAPEGWGVLTPGWDRAGAKVL